MNGIILTGIDYPIITARAFNKSVVFAAENVIDFDFVLDGDCRAVSIELIVARADEGDLAGCTAVLDGDHVIFAGLRRCTDGAGSDFQRVVNVETANDIVAVAACVLDQSVGGGAE